MFVTNISLLSVRLTIPPLACVVGVERGKGSGTVWDRGWGGRQKGRGSGFRRGLPWGPTVCFSGSGISRIWISGFGIFKQNGGEIRDWKYRGKWDAKKENIGITGLHEIWGRDCGIEESYWGPSAFCLFHFPWRKVKDVRYTSSHRALFEYFHSSVPGSLNFRSTNFWPIELRN